MSESVPAKYVLGGDAYVRAMVRQSVEEYVKGKRKGVSKVDTGRHGKGA